MNSYGDLLKELLRPLGIYRLEESINAAELESMGQAMDAVAEVLDIGEKEALIATAEAEGLRNWESLFALKGVRRSLQERREALAGLCWIDLDCLTLPLLNRCLCGCGIAAQVEETESYGVVRVSFPGTMGVPEDFEQIRGVILDIIPCHLETEFFFRYISWQDCHAAQWTWHRMEEETHSWQSFQVAV